MTINLEKSLEIDAPIDQVYEQWADFNAYPRFMPHVQEVQPVDGPHWRWQAESEGQSDTWDVEITGQEPGRSISWRTRSPAFNSTSSVQLTPLDDGARTKVLFTSHYPQGVGPSGTAMQIAAEMEKGLAQFAALLTGGASFATQGDDIQTRALGQVDDGPESERDSNAGPARIADLEQTLETASDALVGSVMKTFDTPLMQWGQWLWDVEKQFTDFIWGNLDNRRISAFNGPGNWQPSFEIERQGDMLLASAALPGYTSDHLHVEIRNGRLLVSGERSTSEDEESQSQRSEERFNVSIGLSEPIDSQNVDARLSEDGRLEISLPIKLAAPEEVDPDNAGQSKPETVFWGA